MTPAEKYFLERYYRAGNSSNPSDWLDAALAAKRMYNERRMPEDEEAERKIQYSYPQV